MKYKSTKTNIVIISLLLLFFIASCAKHTTEEVKKDYIIKIVARDDHPLSIDLSQNPYKELILLLNSEAQPNEIKKYLHLNDSQYDLLLNDLYSQGLVKRNNEGKFFPSFMVINDENAEKLSKMSEEIGFFVAEIIKSKIAQIKNEYEKIESLRYVPFDSLSFFILSDVALNKWQITNIEVEFFKSPPPKRGNEFYYLSMQRSNNNSEIEPFGNYYDYAKSLPLFTLHVYTNKRRLRNSIFYNSTKDLENITYSLKFSDYKLNDLYIPVINQDDLTKLKNIADIVSKDLLALLENNRNLLLENYLNSTYKNCCSFREYILWLYQFIIRDATNKLIAENIILLPKNDFQQYIIMNKPID
ncbi:hypothetical protein ABRY23_10770 [Melioribacteraceae bacterium 4301-Me]|uniref:hypothetical protein n=1 Tax=Pyranulibacter aquaticus TaxID=3163344 RepID=UPI00359876BE